MEIVNLLPDEDITSALRNSAADSDSLSATRAQMLLALVEYLRSRGAARRAFGLLLNDRLTLFPIGPSSKTAVGVEIDWPDYGTVSDGLPIMHYRLQFKPPGSHLSQDERAGALAEAERIIWGAFGWTV
jgi:hypothetical protein